MDYTALRTEGMENAQSMKFVHEIMKTIFSRATIKKDEENERSDLIIEEVNSDNFVFYLYWVYYTSTLQYKQDRKKDIKII